VAGHFDPLALDSWVLLAIRVRDLLLSQLVVVLALLAVRALVLLYHPAYRLTGWAVPVLLLGTYAVFRAAATLTGRAVRTRPTPARAIFRRLLVYLAVSLLYGPYFLLITLDFLRQRHWVVGPLGALAIGPPSLSVGALGVAVGALAGAGFGYRMDVRQGRRLREAGSRGTSWPPCAVGQCWVGCTACWRACCWPQPNPWSPPRWDRAPAPWLTSPLSGFLPR
jgi:hypothetical protein